MPMSPSAAMRPAFFAAFASPFLRSQSTANSRLPLVSVRAALQSIIPAPVFSRSSFTICEVTLAIVPHRRGYAKACQLVCGDLLRLRDPALDSPRETDLL